MMNTSIIRLILITSLFFATSCASTSRSVGHWFENLFSNGSAEESLEDQAAAAEFRRQEQDYAVQHALRNRDVVRGMSREDVRQAWGEPRSREIAGEERSGNERWIYTLGVSSRWSLAAKKMVYFERGQVVGWETE